MSRMSMDFQRQMDELRKNQRTPTREERKGEKKAVKSHVIAQVRARVFELDRACICGKCKPSDKFDEMHEVVSRAQLRGRPPEDIFNVRNCVRLSRKCHLLVTGTIGKGKAITISFLDDALAMGRIKLTWKNGQEVVYHRPTQADGLVPRAKQIQDETGQPLREAMIQASHEMPRAAKKYRQLFSIIPNAH